MKTFADFNLSNPLASAVAEMGFTAPTPIQEKTLEALLEGPTDLLGLAATGTGKTAAFGIPLLERVDAAARATQALILCPTRELTQQVTQQISLLGRNKGVHAFAIYGGSGYGEQIRAIQQGAHIVVATPGRLIDHLRKGTLSLAQVHTVVLDEADEMLSMGFKEDLEFLLSQVPKGSCNTWLFTATMSADLRRVADRYMRNPKVAQANQTEMLSQTVQQVYYTIREKNKPKGLCKLLDMADDFYGLIFCQTKALVSDLTDYLRQRGYPVECMHGDKTQGERERILKQFRDRTIRVMVCSDVAARGLDVKDLTHVINYTLPKDFDSYVHRIGRTARSGASGIAINLVSPAQMHLVGRIEALTKTKMQQAILPARRGISAKKVAQILPQFSAAEHTQKAAELLDDAWKTALESMTKEEIAARFLSLGYPGLFVAEDDEEAVGLGFREREPRGERGGFRPERGGPRPPRERGGFRRPNQEFQGRPDFQEGAPPEFRPRPDRGFKRGPRPEFQGEAPFEGGRRPFPNGGKRPFFKGAGRPPARHVREGHSNDVRREGHQAGTPQPQFRKPRKFYPGRRPPGAGRPPEM